MEKRILVPFDNSVVSRDIIRIADDWATRINGELYFLHASPKTFFSSSKIQPWQREKKLKGFIESLEVKAKYQVLTPIGKPYQKIIEEERRIHADLIIMAAHSHTAVARALLGSNTDFVIHRAGCPVFVYKKHPEDLEKHIIVPIDFSDVNRIVAQEADDWAKISGSKLTFIHIGAASEIAHYNYEFNRTFDDNEDEHGGGEDEHSWSWDKGEQEKKKQEVTAELAAFIGELKIESKHDLIIDFGKPSRKILDLQKKLKANLIMIAAHSHTSLERVLAGSNTDFLLHNVDCPMYVHK